MSTSVATVTTTPTPRLESAALVTLCLFTGAVQLSIAASAWLLTLTLLLWAGVLVSQRERIEVPPHFWPLLAYAGVTMVSVAASIDPVASLGDSKGSAAVSRGPDRLPIRPRAVGGPPWPASSSPSAP